MPLFEYQCGSCGYQFEELKNSKEDNESSTCSKCGAVARKQLSRFSSSISGGSPTEPVDVSIGREANKRWQSYHDRQETRRARGVDLGTGVDVPRMSDGRYQPVMALGGDTEKGKRKEFTTALQEHRKERERKGIPQFSDSGAV